MIQFLKSLDNDTNEKDIEGDSIRKYKFNNYFIWNIKKNYLYK